MTGRQPATLAALAAAGLIDATWAAALAPVEPAVQAMETFLRAEVAAGRGYLPEERTCCARSARRCRPCGC